MRFPEKIDAKVQRCLGRDIWRRSQSLVDVYRRPMLDCLDEHSQQNRRQDQKRYPEQQSINDTRQSAPLINQCRLRRCVLNTRRHLTTKTTFIAIVLLARYVGRHIGHRSVKHFP